MTRFLAAVVQLSSTSDQAANLRVTEELIGRAARRGARLVSTPENTNFLGPHRDKVRLAEDLEGPLCLRFSELAARLRIHLVLGSFNERYDNQRCFNTSVLFGPDGDILGVYRKMHLFDVDVSDEVRFAESQTIRAGDSTTVVSTPLAQIGLSICYDLRFPEIYRVLVDEGAQILTVPSAFTLMTGKDHWSLLLQARAIECQSWILAAAQTGRHDDQGLRHSYGHSMIVDPWGKVVAMVGEGPGLAMAEIDLERQDEVRRAMPLGQHRRFEVRPIPKASND